MKVKVLLILAALTLFVTCENPFVSNILPDRDGGNGSGYVPPPGSFTVTFDKNGGDTEASPRTKIVTPPATKIDALPAQPTRSNYTFAGWNTAQNGSGATFTATTTVTASITVYAKWTPQSTGPTTAIVNFENDSLGYTYTALSGASSLVVTDPVNTNQKSLRVTSSNYNQAVIIPINLTAALNTAESFSFKFNLTNGTLSYKRILVYIAGSAATFVDGAFGNEANNPDGYPEFAANLLCRTDEINEPAPNQWHEYTIPITGASLNNAIANLPGTVPGTAYLAIGINHGTNEGITYLLDDLTFTFPGGPPPTDAPPIVDFEDDTLGTTTKYTVTTAPQNGTGTVTIVNDPVNNGQKSLSMNSTGYNIGAVIPINLPKALNQYNSFTFRFNMLTGSLNDKDMMVYVARETSAFGEYGFGNPSTDQHNFAANLLGSVTLTDVKNRWDAYEILITNPGNDISTLSGNVYIAIGINHNDNITYLLDDLTFSDALPANFPTLVTFEDDDVGKTYNTTSGTNSPTSVAVAVDPSASSQKSLKVVTNGSGNAYNQAAIIPINVPDALSTYRSFTFRFYYTGSTLMDNTADEPRKINVYVADAPAKFIRYAFGNPAGNANQFATLLVGAVEPEYGASDWVDYAINFTAGSAISALTGNVYVAIGINHGDSVTYYLDDLTFSKEEVQKTAGADLTGTLLVTNIGHTSVVVNEAGGVPLPGNGQVIEYAVSTEATAPTTGWQENNTLAVTANTSYYAYARAKANYQFYAGTAISSAQFTTPAKSPGATLTATITEVTAQKRHNRIVINVTGIILTPATGQTVEYAASLTTDTTELAADWQDSTTFSGLDPNTSYYVFARAKENGDYLAGSAISGGPFTTAEYTAPPVPPTIVDFEDKIIGDTYNRVSGQGNSTAAVVADPDTVNHSGEKSLQITSTNWNNGAIIPINLPFALQNYESFTLRYRLATSMPENNRGNGLWVYVTDSPSSLPGNQLGNNNASYTSILLKNIVPDYSVINEWVDYDIEIIGGSLNSAIKELQGDIFLVIGINSAQSITYQLDDLTFNINDEFVPTPTISPATATFDKNTSNTAQHKDIEVTVNLYGNTFSSIKNGTTELSSEGENADYTMSDSTVTLSTAYLNDLAIGTTTLTFTFNEDATNESVKTLVITVRDSSGSLLMYTFANGVDPGAIVSNTNNFNVEVSGNVLRVTFTTTYNNRTFALPFKLPENETLANYWGIRMKARRVSGDIDNSKTMRAEAKKEAPLDASGNNLAFGNVAKNPLMPGTGEWTYIDIPRATGAAANSLSGELYIGFYVDNTTQFVYEIESIELCKTQPAP